MIGVVEEADFPITEAQSKVALQVLAERAEQFYPNGYTLVVMMPNGAAAGQFLLHAHKVNRITRIKDKKEKKPKAGGNHATRPEPSQRPSRQPFITAIAIAQLENGDIAIANPPSVHVVAKKNVVLFSALDDAAMINAAVIFLKQMGARQIMTMQLAKRVGKTPLCEVDDLTGFVIPDGLLVTTEGLSYNLSAMERAALIVENAVDNAAKRRGK